MLSIFYSKSNTFFKLFLLLFYAGSFVTCANMDLESNENSNSLEQIKRFGAYQTGSLWPDSTNIPVCWTTPDNLTYKNKVESWIRNSWERVENINFIGWNDCEVDGGIRIEVIDSPGRSYVTFIGSTEVLPTNVFYAVTMVLYSEVSFLQQEFFQNDRQLIYGAIHEFGHALGLRHEQDRSDAECEAEPKRDNNVGHVGVYDPESIMNYCIETNSPRFSSPTTALSDGDIATIQALYDPSNSLEETFSRNFNFHENSVRYLIRPEGEECLDFAIQVDLECFHPITKIFLDRYAEGGITDFESEYYLLTESLDQDIFTSSNPGVFYPMKNGKCPVGKLDIESQRCKILDYQNGVFSLINPTIKLQSIQLKNQQSNKCLAFTKQLNVRMVNCSNTDSLLIYNKLEKKLKSLQQISSNLTEESCLSVYNWKNIRKWGKLNAKCTEVTFFIFINRFRFQRRQKDNGSVRLLLDFAPNFLVQGNQNAAFLNTTYTGSYRNQKWELIYNSVTLSGQIREANADQCITAKNSVQNSLYYSYYLNYSECNGEVNEKFQFRADGKIQIVGSNHCLYVVNNYINDDAGILTYVCDTSNRKFSQIFRITESNKIALEGTDYCLDLPEKTDLFQQQRLRINPCSSPDVEEFTFEAYDPAKFWTSVEITDFPARSQHSSVVFNDNIYVIGGKDSNGAKSDVWRSSDGVVWEKISENQFLARFGHTSVVLNNYIYIIAGFSNGAKSDVWRSNDGVAWEKISENQIRPGFGHTSVIFNNYIYVIGGRSGEEGVSQSIYRSRDGIRWNFVGISGATRFAARSNHTSVTFDNYIYVIGGINDRFQFHKDVWRSSDGARWEQVKEIQLPARAFSSSVIFDNKIYSIAGLDSLNIVFQSDVWHSSNGAIWERSVENQFAARKYHSSVVFNNRIYLIGGVSSGATILNDIQMSGRSR